MHHNTHFQERHLQEVILAQQTNSVKKKHVYIPTPDAAITVAHYEEIAKPVQRTMQYIRVPGKSVVMYHAGYNVLLTKSSILPSIL